MVATVALLLLGVDPLAVGGQQMGADEAFDTPLRLGGGLGAWRRGPRPLTVTKRPMHCNKREVTRSSAVGGDHMAPPLSRAPGVWARASRIRQRAPARRLLRLRVPPSRFRLWLVGIAKAAPVGALLKATRIQLAYIDPK